MLCLDLLAERAEDPAATLMRWETRDATRISRACSTLTEILETPAGVAAMRQIRSLVDAV
ncbi:hypothetical protein AB0L63_02595 [Nocardia sp. NPDC051990]|uniref:hypothetical protein n=1 Tax=Nocardia sp. NPDC051990 TaxID=3155285 RepID=UPI00342E390D